MSTQQKERVLVISGSADASEVMCGGTMAKYAKNGHEVILAVVTYGEMGHPSLPPEKAKRVRIKEQEEAAAVEGVKQVKWLGFEDTRVRANDQLRESIARLVREVKPSIVITNWFTNLHPDLAYTAYAVRDALLWAWPKWIKFDDLLPHSVNTVYMAGIGGFELQFSPSVYVDISDVIDVKKQALECHHTCIEAEPNWPDRWITQNRYWGMESGVDYAEVFTPYRKYATDFLPTAKKSVE